MEMEDLTGGGDWGGERIWGGGRATGLSQRQAAFSQADCVSTTFHSPRQDGTLLAKRVGLSHRQ